MIAQRPPNLRRILAVAITVAVCFGAAHANNPFEGFPTLKPPSINGPLPPPPLVLDVDQLPQVREKPPLPKPPIPQLEVTLHPEVVPIKSRLGIVGYPGLLRWPSKLLITTEVQTKDPNPPPLPVVKLLGLSSGENPVATISVDNKIRHYQAGSPIAALEGQVESITYNTVIISTPSDVLILSVKGNNP